MGHLGDLASMGHELSSLVQQAGLEGRVSRQGGGRKEGVKEGGREGRR